jgi:hypothetical protein
MGKFEICENLKYGKIGNMGKLEKLKKLEIWENLKYGKIGNMVKLEFEKIGKIEKIETN